MGRKKSISDSALLDVAREVFVKRGFSASTKEIARQAGISEGVLFQRFVSKDELFFAAMIPPPASLSELFRHSRARGKALIEKVMLAMLEYSRASLPVLLPLMTHPGFCFEEFAQRHPDTALNTLRRELTQFMIEQKRAGYIGDVEPGPAALVIWSTALAIAFFERLGAHGGKFAPGLVRQTMDCMWEGLRPPSGLRPDGP